ncbi:MAG: hypothetical protein RBU37_00605 [Myxococcota bacterium]|jgi:hypothetical protein|nr:hypothetical protein [Myxococcota bacterium]
MKMRWLLMMGVFSLVTTSCAWAHAQPAGKLAAKTERVIIFKDGHALFIKKAQGSTDAEGRLLLEDLPEQAVLGTVWASSKQQIVSIRAAHVEDDDALLDSGKADSMAEMLLANRDRDVKLSISGKELDAHIIDVLDPSSGTLSSGDALLLYSANGSEQVAFVRDVERLSSSKLSLDFERRGKRTQKSLLFDLGKDQANAKVEIDFMYFRSGLGWTPSYRLLDDGGKRVQLALQAELTNDAEDIDNARAELVVGVPNFRFAGELSPLILENAIRQYDPYAFDNYAYRNDFSNAIYSQQVSSHGAGYAPGPMGGPTMLEAGLSGESKSDLFSFADQSFSMKKGERMTKALWTASAERTELYTLKLAPTRNGYGYGSYGSYDAGSSEVLELLENDVWHQLELRNDGSVPWTTGAALVLQDDFPIAQELLTFTPAGGTTLLPLTRAVDIRAVYEETELSRESSSSLFGTNLTEIKLKGTVKLVNHRSEAVRMRIDLSLGGRVDKASDKGKLTVRDFAAEDWYGGADPENNHSEVVWDFELAAGASKELSVEFSYLVR